MKKRKRFLKIDEIPVPRKLRKIEDAKDAKEINEIRKTIKRISEDRIRETIESIKERTKRSQYTIMVTTPDGVTQMVLISTFYAQKSKEWSKRLDKASSLQELEEVEKEIEALNF